MSNKLLFVIQKKSPEHLNSVPLGVMANFYSSTFFLNSISLILIRTSSALAFEFLKMK